MRRFFIFLGGFLTSLLVVGALGYYFVFQAPSRQATAPAPAPVSVQVPEAEEEMVSFKATVVVPEPLRESVKSGAGRIAVGVKTGHPFRLALQQERPNFPLEIAFSLPLKIFSPGVEAIRYARFTVRYCPTSGSEPCQPFGKEDVIEGFTRINYSYVAKKAKDPSQPIDLGAIFFTRRYPPVTECKESKVSLAGKIIPTRDFMKKYKDTKFALLVLPTGESDSNRMTFDLAVAPNEVPGRVFHYQFLDFSKGPMAFSVPYKPTPNKHFVLNAFECDPGADLNTCVSKAFPFNKAMINDQAPVTKHRAHVVGKGFTFAYCGQTDYEGYVHTSIPVLRAKDDYVPLPVNLPKPKDPISPAEYVEGANL